MPSPTFGDVLAENIRAIRSRKRLGQTDVGERMRSLGFDQWHRQTMGKVERGERRLMAEEIIGLAFALETSIGTLLDPPRDDQFIALPNGHLVGINTVLRSVRHYNDGMVWWEGDEPRFDSGEPSEMLATPESIGLQQDPFIDLTPEMVRRRNERIEPAPPPRRRDED
jgi:transcriptional regulator with XRE-family HTH domain